jgi:membrane fusion protein, copper/silver efflux system
MNRKILYAIIFCVTTLGIVACSDKKKQSIQSEHADHIRASNDSASHDDMITLSQRDEQYANITIDTVRTKSISEYTTLLGTTALDERNITVVTSRIRGRLDKLFVRTPQQWVTKRQPLYAVYSEELLSYENEYLNALQQQSQFNSMKQVIDQLVEGSKKKLLLWGLTGEQISDLEKNKEPSALVTFNSPVSGTLVDLAITEGQYVETGTALFKIADLSKIWVEAQLYTNELRWLYEKPSITVEFDAYPNKIIAVKPVFDNPSIEADQKISLIRFLVPNSGLLLKPGMMAYVNIRRNEKKTLVIPKSSLVVGNMTTAWVKTGDGMYENRIVELGIQNKREVEVINGLKEGDLVVTNGAYLLNSALVLKKGAGMEGMKM